jgi:hypothetical protein
VCAVQHTASRCAAPLRPVSEVVLCCVGTDRPGVEGWAAGTHAWLAGSFSLFTLGMDTVTNSLQTAQQQVPASFGPAWEGVRGKRFPHTSKGPRAHCSAEECKE